MNEVGQYQKKPIVVEAVQWPCDLAVLEAWGCEVAAGGLWEHPDGGEGAISVWNVPDACWKEIPRRHWVIKGPAEGDFYPCAPEIFADTYEAVQHSHGLEPPPGWRWPDGTRLDA